jgi:hypothetical protein
MINRELHYLWKTLCGRSLLYATAGAFTCLGYSQAEASGLVECTVENTLARERLTAPVVVSRGSLGIPEGETVLQLLVLKDGTQWERPFQLDDMTGDGEWDELFFAVNISAHNTVELQIVFGEGASPDFASQVQAGIDYSHGVDRCYWESQLSGYNMYGATQSDCVGKLYPKLVFEEWYSDPNASQHRFSARDGHDYMQVGNTMGGHSTYVSDGQTVYRPWTDRAFALVGDLPHSTTIQSTVVADGPLRAIIKTHVGGLVTSDGEVGYDMIQSISSMQRHTQVTIRPDPLMAESGLRVGAGYRLFYEDGMSETTEDYTTHVACNLWESGLMEERVARAIITPFSNGEVQGRVIDEANEFAPKNGPNWGVLFRPCEAIHYAFVTAWEKDDGFSSMELWSLYLRQVAEDIRNPLKVTIH